MKKRMRRQIAGIDVLGWALALLAACLVASGAAAFEAPDGWGGAKFGMSPEQVQELFPTAKVEQDTGEPTSATSDRPRFIDLRVEGQEVLGMADCKVRFRFASSQLHMIGCVCPPGEKSVAEVLEAKFGKPTHFYGPVAYWRGELYGVSLRLGVIGFYDRQLDAAVQRSNAAAVRAGSAQPMPTGADTAP